MHYLEKELKKIKSTKNVPSTLGTRHEKMGFIRRGRYERRNI